MSIKVTPNPHQMMNFKIATLNFCLGLKNKKDIVKNILLQERISVFSLQLTEIENSFNKNILRIPGFNLELETNTRLSRTGFYILLMTLITHAN